MDYGIRLPIMVISKKATQRDDETILRLCSFDRVEAARIVGVPYTTFGNWAEELGIVPDARDEKRRGVPALYSSDALFIGGTAKALLEGGLSKKAVRVASNILPAIWKAADWPSSGKEIGGLVGTGKALTYLPREKWEDRAELQKTIAEQTDLCWILDLKPIFDRILAATLPVLQSHIMDEYGFILRKSDDGRVRMTFRDGRELEGDSIDSIDEQLDALTNKFPREVSYLAAAITRHTQEARAKADDMEDAAQFVGYSDAQAFDDDLTRVRETLKEIATKK